MTPEPAPGSGAPGGTVPGPVLAPVSASASAAVRLAATVMLLRQAPRGPEVFTLQRVSAMAFAGGMTVFPGGGVDPSDRGVAPSWSGPDAQWWAERWGVGAAIARTVLVTAVRELYEETGVLLATPQGTGARAPVPAGAGADRDDLVAHRRALADVLRARRLAVDAGGLTPWARWITPVGQPRRYDTFFFAAALPAGQDPDFATTEAIAGGWHRPADLLAAGADGRVGLMPPTVAMLTDLAAVGSVAEALAAPRALAPVVNDRAPAVSFSAVGSCGGAMPSPGRPAAQKRGVR